MQRLPKVSNNCIADISCRPFINSFIFLPLEGVGLRNNIKSIAPRSLVSLVTYNYKQIYRFCKSIKSLSAINTNPCDVFATE